MPVNARQYIRARQVYTATGSEPLTDGAVVLEGSKVSAVVPARDLTNQDTKIADFPNGTVLPGLIDAHCHLTLAGDGRSYAELAADPDPMMALVSARNMARHLASGVTTLRDNGGRNDVSFILREACERGYFTGPRLLLAGRPVTHTRGHFHWCNGTADGLEGIRRAVRELVADGADHIKIMASGGGTEGTVPYLPSYAVDELAMAVRTAHELDRPTTAHCRAKQAVVNAVEAGLDCIEHYEFLVRDPAVAYGAATAGGRIEYDPAVTEKVLATNTFVSFTMSASYGTLLSLRAAKQSRPLTPGETRRYDALERYFDAKLGLFRMLLDDGLMPQLVISSDAGCGDDAFGTLHHGLELAVAAGMTPRQALDSVTATASAAAEVSGTVGTLAPGKQADLVVIDGDPLADITRMRRVLAVYRDGTQVAPQTASA